MEHKTMQNPPRSKVALVTGAASGLGEQFSRRLAKDGYEFVLVDRQGDTARAVADAIAQTYAVGTHVIEQDLSDPAAARRIFEFCHEAGLHIDILVNNAGYVLDKAAHLLPWATCRDHIQVLLKTTVEMCHRFVQPMIEKGSGQIINVSSVSGFMPGAAGVATYNASKAFLIPFSEGICIELAEIGVNVTVVCPGFMKTNIFKIGAQHVRDAVPSFMWVDPARVADEAIRAVSAGKPVHISGLPNKLIVAATKFVPRFIFRERARILHPMSGRSSAKVDNNSTSNRGKVVLVTGASSGIGADLSNVFAADGFDVMLVARRGDVLKQRASEISKRYGVRAYSLAQDMTDTDAADRIDVECARLGLAVDVVVNNAASQVTKLFHTMPWEEISDALDLLIGAPAAMTHRYAAKMVERGSGTIVNIASLAAFQPGTWGSVIYISSKAFVLTFSESIAAEVRASGVYVTAICPGFTRTDWFKNTKVDSVPSIFWMESADVAAKAFRAARRGAQVAVVGTVPLRAMYAIFRMLPRRFVAAVLSRKRRSIDATERKREGLKTLNV
ncbi:SDR family NAD(P)-dependent oxidoreductase [Bradyrhizobium sp.]